MSSSKTRVTGNSHAGNRVTRLADASLPTRFGSFKIAAYRVDNAPHEIVAIFRGEPADGEPPLVRLHSECLTGDTLGSLRCDCGEQLAAALTALARVPHGILLYLPQEGRGIGLVNKIRAYALQDAGMDTVDANLALGLPIDGRDYTSAAAVLRHLGAYRIRLLTNNPLKRSALQHRGIDVIEQVPLVVAPNAVNAGYLRTKAERMGHALVSRDDPEQGDIVIERIP